MGVIQRAPQGLLELLSAKGVENLPQDLLRELRPTVDLVQFYGNQQRTLLTASNAALAKGGTLSAGVTTTPVVLFGVNAQFAKTATLASIGAALFASGPFATVQLKSIYQTLVAAADGNWRIEFISPYPMIFLAGTSFFVSYDAGTDATANVVCSASIGNLG